MKKIISILLALIMTFSLVTVAFAEGEVADGDQNISGDASTEGENEGTTDEEATDFGDLQWILDLPFWTVGPAFKFAKIAFKLVSAYLKVAKIFGIVDQDMEDMILNAIISLMEGEEIVLPDVEDLIPNIPGLLPEDGAEGETEGDTEAQAA